MFPSGVNVLSYIPSPGCHGYRLTCAVQLQGGQDLRGVQLNSERRDVKTSGVALGDHTLQEHGPGSTDQVHQSVLTERSNQSGGS